MEINMQIWRFGYEDCTLVYWLYAEDKADLLQQIDAKDMREPDWIDGE